MVCALLECHEPAVTVLTYSTCPHRQFPLCEPHHREALAWIRSRWGAEVTITEAPIEPDRPGQPALFAAEEV